RHPPCALTFFIYLLLSLSSFQGACFEAYASKLFQREKCDLIKSPIAWFPSPMIFALAKDLTL
ncbi:hypothetical protein, partial [Longirhabdus pacifica]|uniref:hypothetical protein n=1 Tax=Longirhabdus pacifica TaxID=2305227 RepID=UPI00197D928A